jgi:hypothetical protein
MDVNPEPWSSVGGVSVLHASCEKYTLGRLPDTVRRDVDPSISGVPATIDLYAWPGAEWGRGM